jgi:DNA-binding GntR family transcriptional regulator
MSVFAHKQLWESIADELREEILSARLAAGSRLVETELADRFGVSRGPIRDAITQLAREGLVEDLPRRGAFVASLTEEDLREVYLIRSAIEEAAVRLAVAKATNDDIAGMYARLAEVEEAYDRGDLPAAWDADMAFHRAYCQMSGVDRLCSIFEDLAAQTVLLMRTSLATRSSLAWTPPVELHRHIADAIRARDADAAVAAVAAHYQYTHDRLAAGETVTAVDPSADANDQR